MKCWGRTKTWRRCSREASRFFFCHDHRWQPLLALGSVVTVLLSSVALYKEVITPVLRFIKKPLPEFSITSTGVGVPEVGTTITFAQIKDYRQHTLTITNRSDVGVRDMRLRVQFPEPIVSVRSADPTMAKTISASADWEKTSFELIGQPDARAEATPNEELTGVWRIAVSSINAHDVVNIEITTTRKVERGLGLYLMGTKSFSERFPKIQRSEYWMIHGICQNGMTDNHNAKEFVVPLKFDESARTLTALAANKSTAANTNLVRITQAPGFRVSGLFRTAGVVLITRGADEFTFSPIMTESPKVRFAGRIKLAGRFVNIAIGSNNFRAAMPLGSSNFEAIVPLNQTLTIPLEQKSK